jgi:hypothetical protein
MTDEKTQQESKVPIRWVKSPEGLFQTYANQMHINWSLDDVRLRFAEIGPSNDAGPGDKLISVYVEKAAITITWRNAKILLNGLSAIISNYEKVNGEINLKPELASNEGT